jgi:ubiquinone/menaquinone biosynthesis C-methylase UbiE
MKKPHPQTLQSSDPQTLQYSDPHIPQGWTGWDAYAPFYDWENARTFGRRDVPFWRRFALGRGGRVLELGCGTGRVLMPLARAGVPIVGIDRSAPMLDRARRRLRRMRAARAAALVRGDIRTLPFGGDAFDVVIAPYGILQSLTRDADLAAALRSIAGVLRAGGAFGLDLVPDLPRWSEYARRISLRGTGLRRGTHLTLVESVRQDRRRHLTIFDQEYVERRARSRRVHAFSLVFRTLSVPQMSRRIERAGFRIEAVLGDYDGGPWDPRADVWLILARRR